MFGKATICYDSVIKQPKYTPHLQLELLQIHHSLSEGKCQSPGSTGVVVPTRTFLAFALSGSYLQQDYICAKLIINRNIC